MMQGEKMKLMKKLKQWLSNFVHTPIADMIKPYVKGKCSCGCDEYTFRTRKILRGVNKEGKTIYNTEKTERCDECRNILWAKITED